MREVFVIFLVLLTLSIVLNAFVLSSIPVITGRVAFAPWIEHYTTDDYIYGNVQKAGENAGTGMPSDGTETAPEISAYSDKKIYGSGEGMKTTVLVSGGSGTATLRVFGVMDRGGSYRINSAKEVNLGGSSEEVFDFRMPSCYGCAGVSPGDYIITAELVQDENQIAMAEFTITLQK